MEIRKFILLLFACLLPAISLAKGIRFGTMTCDFRKDPIAVDSKRPVFGWTLQSDADNAHQQAYEIIVSDCLDSINNFTGNQWYSGIVQGSNNIHVKYEGNPLQPFTRYYWRVRVHDASNRPSPWSDVARFTMAMLDESDWEARWIGDGSVTPVKAEDFYKDDPAPLFGREFSVEKEIESATLYISGLGYYEAYLNGIKISDYFLDAGWTAYDKQVLYNVHDISSLVKEGNNDLGVIIGNGWYNLLPLKFWGQRVFRDVLTSGRPVLKAQVRLLYPDGSVKMISTDEKWRVARTPVIRNSIFLGEYHDATLEDTNWYGLKDRTSDWEAVSIVQGPTGRMAVQTSPPVKAYKEITPERVIKQPGGKFLFDMGENFAGIVKIKVKGPKGRKITLRYGEDIHPDGTINVMTSVAGQIKAPGTGGPGAPDIAWQEDNYILKGDEGIEEWHPKFTFHSFRYVEVTGWPGIPDRESITGLALAADLERSGSFTCSNPMFNSLFEVIDRTFLSNVFSVQSDCPAREKLGYGGDIVATAESYMFNYDMHTFYRKTVQDFANDQRTNGGITETAPYVGISDEGPDAESGPLGWQLAYPYLIKQLYNFYGNTSIICDHFGNLKKQVDFLIDMAHDDLYFAGLSDHEALDDRPIALTSSLFYYHHVKLFAEFAGILNEKEAEKEYTRKSESIRQKIIQHFFNKDGQVDNGTQTAQVFAFWYQIIQDNKARDNLINKLEESFAKQGWHISTGIFGTKMLFDVLRDLEKEEWAYEIANQPTFPGWGHMLGQGATTLWETWAYSDNMYSQNHPMFGSINEWFYRSILGINAVDPGFKKIMIKPQVPEGLSWASGHYNSIQGRIGSTWKIDEDQFYLDVEIPANTVAEIWLPKNKGTIVYESGLKINDSKRILNTRVETNYIVAQVGSGKYNFQVSH